MRRRRRRLVGVFAFDSDSDSDSRRKDERRPPWDERVCVGRMSGKAGLMRLLKSANEALKSGDAKGARELSREATEADASVYEAWVMDGKCAHACGDVEDAIASYEKALGIKPEHAAAYQGLNEVYEANGNVEKRLEVLRHLVKSHKESKFEKYVEFLRQGCECAWANERWNDAAALCGEYGALKATEGVDENSRVEALRRACHAALELRDARAVEAGEAAVQVLRSTTIASKSDEDAIRKVGARTSYADEDETLSVALKAWLSEEAANASFDARAHAAEFTRLDALLAAALSSTVNCDFDVKTCARAALREALSLMGRWGDVAIDLVEEVSLEIVAALELGLDCEDEGWDSSEVDDDQADAVKLVKIVTATKPNAVAQGWLALCDVGRSGAFAHSSRPVNLPREKKGLLSDDLRDDMIATLNASSLPAASCALGWLALAESMLVGGERADVHALQASNMALKILRNDVTADVLPKTARRVLLVNAESMIRSGMFREASSSFSMLEGPRAMRGLATCALYAHPPDYRGALEILSSAVEAYPNVKRTQAELGWLSMIAGSQTGRQEALKMLEGACGASASQALSTSTPVDVSARLGVARWRTQASGSKGPGSAHEALLIGASDESAYRAAAFAHLGLVCAANGDDLRSKKCHARALALDPTDPTAGPIVCSEAIASGDDAKATSICRKALAMDSRCSWAANRLAPLCAQSGDHEGAILALQAVLRVSPRNSGAWEALGASYNVLGRHSAALRAFEKAMELSDEDGEGIRPFASAQTGHINLTLGSSVEAVDAYEQALSDGVERVAALFGLASSHLYYAKGALKWGAPGRAAESLRAAQVAAERVVQLVGDESTATVYKLLGDVLCLSARVNDPSAGKDFKVMLEQRKIAATGAVRAYERAVSVKRDQPARWRDLITSIKLERDIDRLRGDVESVKMLEARALETCMEYLKCDPGDPHAWLAVASVDDVSIASEDLRLERRKTALSRAVALNPTFADAWCALGRIYLSNGDVASAIGALDSARIADPSSGEAWTATAALNIARDKLKEACGAFRMAATLGAGAEADLGYALTACALDVSRAKDAYAAARRARESLPSDPAAALALALCSECRGLLTEASNELGDALSLLDVSSDASVVNTLNVDLNVVKSVADTCRARVAAQRESDPLMNTHERCDDIQSALRRVSVLVHKHPGVDRFREALARVASCASDHKTVVAGASVCPLAKPHGNHKVQAAVDRASAACALNASTVLEGDAMGERGIRLAARAAMFDPGSPESIHLLKIAASRRKGISSDPGENEYQTALKGALAKYAEQAEAEAEAEVRAVIKNPGAPDGAQASARIILASFLIARANRDGDKKASKEAGKVLAKVPPSISDSLTSLTSTVLSQVASGA